MQGIGLLVAWRVAVPGVERAVYGVGKTMNLLLAVLSHDDTVFWDHVDLQKLHVDNNHHDIYDGDSDDDAADEDNDEDNDEDDDDDDDDENNDDAADDLFCYENAGPSN